MSIIILPRYDSQRYVPKENVHDKKYYCAFDLHENEFVTEFDPRNNNPFISCYDTINKAQEKCNALDTEDALYTVAILEYTTGEEVPFNQFQ